MAADAPPRQRFWLLALAGILAASSALAGALTTSLLLRQAVAPATPPVVMAASGTAGCAPLAPGPRGTDAAAALDAALGRPPEPMPRQAGALALADLLAVPSPASALVNAGAAPISAPLIATPAIGPAVAPAAGPALAAPPILAGYTLDLGYFLVPEQAVAFATRVQERGVPVALLNLPDASGRVWTHVRTPPFAGSAQALAGAERIERELGVATSLVPPGAAPTPPAAGAPRP